MKKLQLLALLLFIRSIALFAQDFVQLKAIPKNIEVEVLSLDVLIISSDDDFASYKVNIFSGKKPSCVENRGTLRLRSVYAGSGSLVIKLPKQTKLERLKISSALANIQLRDLEVVHAHILLTRGDISIKNCTFKTSMLTHNSGILNFQAAVKSSAICATNSKAEVEYLGKTKDYYVDYSQANSLLMINGQVTKKHMGFLGNVKAIKRASISISASVLNIAFPVNQKESSK